jgi:2,4-dienoyl-CoA reductase-like NADH-dependent reductase (Old Yellow Enzyme family)
MTGNVMIDRGALGEPKNIVLDRASNIEAFKQWAQAGTANGAQLWMQLNHPGKQSPNFLSKTPIAPSEVPLGDSFNSAFNRPRAMTEVEIQQTIDAFAWAAIQAKNCGFSGVQIHAAHGYLVSQFLSPHHNRRQDCWGGPLGNRMRFLLEIYREIRKTVGADFPIGVKLNSADFQQGGFTEDESLRVLQTMEAQGIDLIEISGGNYESPAMVEGAIKNSTRKREAFFLDFAEQAKRQLDVPLVVTGGFRSGAAMNQALQQGATDLIGLARPLAIDPHFTNKLLADNSTRITLKHLSTGIPKLDFLCMLDITWYEHQLARIAKGRSPKPNMSAWYSMFKTFGALGTLAYRRRRG